MSTVLNIYETDKYKLTIEQEDKPNNPRETCYNIGTIVTSSKHGIAVQTDDEFGECIDIGDVAVYDPTIEIANTLNIDTSLTVYEKEYCEYLYEDIPLDIIKAKIDEKAYILPVYLNDRDDDTSIDISSKPLSYDSKSILVGAIYCSYEKAEAEFGELDSKELQGILEEVLNLELDEYSKYLNGEVLSYHLEEKVYTEYNNEYNYITVDEADGFFGYDIENNGLLDSISLNKESLDSLLASKTYSIGLKSI